MPETPPVDPFDQYCSLTLAQEGLQEKLQDGLPPVLAAAFESRVATIADQIESIKDGDGFAASLLRGGEQAAQALDELVDPLSGRKSDEAALAVRRAPHGRRLRLAASFLTEQGTLDPRAVRIRAAAARVGAQTVATQIEHPAAPPRPVPQPPLKRPHPTLIPKPAAHVTADASPAATQPVAAEVLPSIDELFSLHDAALLVTYLQCFAGTLRSHNIELPAETIVEKLLTDEHLAERRHPDAQANLREVRQSALARLGRLLESPTLLDAAIGTVPDDDPRGTLLSYLKDMINPTTYALLSDLIEVGKVLDITFVTPPRSGAQVVKVETVVHIRQTVTTVSHTSNPRQSRYADHRGESPRVYDATPETVRELDIAPHTTRLSNEDKLLAAGCVQYLQRLVPAITDGGIHLGETYNTAFLTTQLCAPTLSAAIVEARKARLLHEAGLRDFTVAAAAKALLFQHALFSEFVQRNHRCVDDLIAAVFTAEEQA